VLDAYRDRVPRVVAALAHMRALAQSMIGALEREDVGALGALVGEHWTQQRALHEKITTPLIDELIETALAHGALGAKALGASGGGSVVVIAPENRVDEVRQRVSALARLLPFIVDREGARVTIHERAGSEAWQS
jgi:D-glycero-alpha-D-manno-heptose-7-phosphate kinase